MGFTSRSPMAESANQSVRCVRAGDRRLMHRCFTRSLLTDNSLTPILLLHLSSGLLSQSPAVSDLNMSLRFAGQSSAHSKSSAGYVMDLVRKYDYEIYLATLMLKSPKVRQTAFSLRALNVELAQIPDVTSSPATASARFAFWSDVVSQLLDPNANERYDGHPVARELKKTMTLSDGFLSKRHLKKLVETRAQPQYSSDFPFDTVSQIEAYSDGAFGPIYALLVECLVSERRDLHSKLLDLDHVASHVSRCTGLVTVLRGTVHNAQRGRCYIPNDLLLKHGATHQQFLRFSHQKEVIDVCYDLSCTAKRHMDTSYGLIGKLSDRAVTNLFLPIALCEFYLQRIEKSNFDLFCGDMQIKDMRLPLKLWYKSLTVKWFGK